MGRIQDLAVGSVLGRYELVLRIASGGMGEVWAARLKGSRGFQKVVAIKTLVPELSHDPNFERMFLDEAQLASRLKHPNVVEVIDLGEEQEVLYQVMEWVEGASLWAVMRGSSKRGNKALPLPVAAGIVAQVCAGLHAAHELKEADGTPTGLVHRDVSPQNVLITPQGLAKVVDFGVAKFAGRAAAATQVGELRGKVPYMAPEHVRGDELDRRADVFALGVLFYQLLSGVHPFLGDTDALTLGRIASPHPAKPLAKVAPEVPEEIAVIVERALAKSPAERIPTAAELRKLIETAVPDITGEGGRVAVSEFCKELGSEHFPSRASREVKDALRRIDNPEAEGAAGARGPDGRPSLTSFPLTPPGLTPPTFTPPGLASDVEAPETDDVDDVDEAEKAEPEAPSPPDAAAAKRRRLGWIAVGSAVALLGVLAVQGASKNSSPAPAAGAPPSASTIAAGTPAPAPSPASPQVSATADPAAPSPGSAEAASATASAASPTPPEGTVDGGAAAHPKVGRGKPKDRRPHKFTPTEL